MGAARARRMASLIKQNIATIILSELGEPEMQWITVTDCVMSNDLKRADIYFTTIEQNLSHHQASRLLEQKTGEIKRHLGSRVRLKFMPELRFIWDDSVLIEEKIEELKRERRSRTE